MPFHRSNLERCVAATHVEKKLHTDGEECKIFSAMSIAKKEVDQDNRATRCSE
jgi:hypothetical protein